MQAASHKRQPTKKMQKISTPNVDDNNYPYDIEDTNCSAWVQ